MKKISFILLLFVSSSLFSQSLLWKISGKKIKNPSYIYGTIHIQDKRAFSFDEFVLEAFESSDAFAMEILMDEIPMQEMMDAMLMKNNTLDKLYTKEEYRVLDSIVKVKTGAGVLLYNKMKPFFLSSQLMQLEMPKDMDLALDLFFLTEARKAGKPCYGVEKFMDQISAIDAISLEEQADMLYKSLTDTAENDTMSKLNEMLETYMNFDLDKMLELSTDSTMPADFNENFLIKRNVVMVKNFLKISKKQSLFCTVGAAHLAGEDGVLELLRKKGYTVEPVFFKWTEN